ncbi:MAG: GPW/gp25 family protein [Roseburia sp.]|nr:GPW/gp25 family protein [Roseburia sp.]
MENNDNTSAIGIGAIFPITIKENSKGQKGWYPVNGDSALIENNLKALLLYEIGQRLRQEDFGTKLIEVLEEPNTSALSFLVREFIMQALTKYEHRVYVTKISSSRFNQKLNILLEFKIIELNMDSFLEAQYNL